jgi:diguanylate cyclase
MNHPENPADLARKTLRRLAAGHLPPTPENYQACYNEIANVPLIAPFPDEQLQRLAEALPARGVVQELPLLALRTAIASHSWPGVENALLDFIAAVASDTGDTGSARELILPFAFSQELASFIESTIFALGEPKERGPKMAGELVQTLRKPPVRIQATQDLLAKACPQARLSAEEQAQIKHSLLNLMHLILENVGQLTLDESWLKGQIDGMLAIIEPPISLRQLHDMERRLRQVIAKQGAARRHSIQAREEMRAMLSTFIESLATMNVSSTSFQAKIEETARKIKNIERIEDLGPLLIDVMEATRMMTEGTSQVREQLKGMQERVVATEATLARLYEELDSISAQARHDPLTDALNRKGLDDALNREISNLQRRNLPLSICLLDIDDFKTLNDRLGHETGDKALIHLANVARHCMRPNDTLARYGGEEFVILMPDTPLASGIEVMTRLQRELTRMFFLSGNEKVLITFSAGVAQVGRDETGIEAINRADQAMYLAKRAGKNRVMGG